MRDFREQSVGLDRAPKYDYDYDGINLSPGSDLHEMLVQEILDRTNESRRYLSGRYDVWRKVQDMLTLYIPLSEEEKNLKAKDPRRPTSIVFPESLTTLETLLTFYASAFLEQSPLFGFRGTGPEDAIGAVLLEKVIEIQSRYFKVPLAMHTMARDSFSFGMGIGAPRWEVEYGNVTVTDIRTGKPQKARDVIYEGNVLENVSPWAFLPDPNYSIHEIQKMEYVGWASRYNRVSLQAMEERGEQGFINCKYLNHIDGRSFFLGEGHRSGDPGDSWRVQYSVTEPVDVIFMYINLIPSEWGLGDGDTAEIWGFALAGDDVIIKASPLGYDHSRYPVVVYAPDFDGYSVSPLGRIETLYGPQMFQNFMGNSRMEEVRRNINGRFVVDPMIINMFDLMEPRPGGFITTNSNYWGRGVKDGIEQLQVQDVTRGHLADMMVIGESMKRLAGTTDIVQGILGSGSERTTATESRLAANAAMSRIQKSISIMAHQGHYDMAYQFASNVSQFMQRDVFVELTGETAERIAREYGQPLDAPNRYRAYPDELRVRWDIQPMDNTDRGKESAEMWIQLFQSIASNEQLAMQFDMGRILKHISRLLGTQSLEDFERKAPPAPMMGQVMPNEEIERQVQAGNMIPAGRAA